VRFLHIQIYFSHVEDFWVEDAEVRFWTRPTVVHHYVSIWQNPQIPHTKHQNLKNQHKEKHTSAFFKCCSIVLKATLRDSGDVRSFLSQTFTINSNALRMGPSTSKKASPGITLLSTKKKLYIYFSVKKHNKKKRKRKEKNNNKRNRK
jgi:hypothetical protein